MDFQLQLFSENNNEQKTNNNIPNLDEYDKFIVGFSGGKDSTASVLHLLDLGVDKDKIELWHHDIDGRETGNFMDWKITADYCRQFADALGLKIYFSWKVGGFEKEMNRENELTAPIKFETPDGLKQAGGKRGKKTTRKKFPQVSPDLSVRWCSAYLKIDVCAIAITNQERFLNGKTLVITGERAEESPSRAKYKTFEPHRTDNRNGKKVNRYVDHWRPVHAWKEKEVWQIIEKYKINPHVSYKLGWGRCSCAGCIFQGCNHWATLKKTDPDQFNKIANYEKEFNHTIARNGEFLDTIAAKGTPFKMSDKDIKMSKSNKYTDSIFVDTWTTPSGAYSDLNCGS